MIKPDVSGSGKDQIREAAALLDAGGLVAFPTETVYGIACSVGAKSLIKLAAVKNREAKKRYSLHIADKNDVYKYVPHIGLRGRRLLEKAWPGPLTAVFELPEQDIDRQRSIFADEVFKCLYADNTIGIRCPDHVVASILLSESSGPVVAPSANKSGQRPAVDAAGVLERFSGEIEVVIDGGTCKYQKNSTVVKIDKKGVRVLREGVYPEEKVRELAKVSFLFVCTGNSCRSPMAEGMFRKYLAEKVGCQVDGLEELGYKVLSAGTMGIVGFPPSSEAIKACEARGIDIKGHRSRALHEGLIANSDIIFTMSPKHLEQVVALDSSVAKKCMPLVEGKEVSDPIGQPQEFYDQCANLIEEAVKKRISEFVI